VCATATRCRREGVATSTLVSPVQYDIMALVDQEPGRHEAEAIRSSGYEYASHSHASCRLTNPNALPSPRVFPFTLCAARRRRAAFYGSNKLRPDILERRVPVS
jgi:hypothetical protein